MTEAQALWYYDPALYSVPLHDPTSRELHLLSKVELHWMGKGKNSKPMLIEAGEAYYREVESKVFLLPWSKLTRDTLHMEGRFPEATTDALARRGHIVDRWEAWNEMAGHAHGITIDHLSGTLCGGSDPRSDGAAIGY